MFDFRCLPPARLRAPRFRAAWPVAALSLATLLASTVAMLLASTVAVRAEGSLYDPSLRRVRLLTQNPGAVTPWDNAEAYFSPDGRRLVFQSSRDGARCDAIYSMDLEGHGVRRISNGRGKTTCAFFSPDGTAVIYASTHAVDPDCPPPPDRSHGYVWPVDPGYDIYRVPLDGGAPIRLTASPHYDAECVYRPDGGRILFTSDRDGDLELYDMDPDGSHVRRLTFLPGYDGGAFYTADGTSIVFRARHPQGAELEEYRRLLAQHLVQPSRLDLYVMDADGAHLRRLTFDGDQGVTNWAPYPHPDGRHVVFASNRDDFDGTVPGTYGYDFELYLITLDGRRLRRLTFHRGFDGFPMFSADGRHLVWCGNYAEGRPHDTDVLLADWVP